LEWQNNNNKPTVVWVLLDNPDPGEAGEGGYQDVCDKNEEDKPCRRDAQH
jgi:hypothetical protein